MQAEASTVAEQAVKKEDAVRADVSPSVDRAGVEHALLGVEMEIQAREFERRAQEAAHEEAIARLIQVRDTLKNALDPEGRMKEFIIALDLERQYHEDCLATLRFFECLGGDVQPLSFEEVSHQFTLAELEEALHFQLPKLVTEVPFAAAVRAIDTHKTMPDQINTYVNASVYEENLDEATEVKPAGRRFSIVDGAEKRALNSYDNAKFTLGGRIRLVKDNRKRGVRGINRYEYAYLQMDGLRRKEPIDRQTWTVLDGDEALSASHVPCAGWGGDQVRFGDDRPRDRRGDASFRSSVGGDVVVRN